MLQLEETEPERKWLVEDPRLILWQRWDAIGKIPAAALAVYLTGSSLLEKLCCVKELIDPLVQEMNPPRP